MSRATSRAASVPLPSPDRTRKSRDGCSSVPHADGQPAGCSDCMREKCGKPREAGPPFSGKLSFHFINRIFQVFAIVDGIVDIETVHAPSDLFAPRPFLDRSFKP